MNRVFHFFGADASWQKALLSAGFLFHVFAFAIALVRRSWLVDDSIQYLQIAGNFSRGMISQSVAEPWLPDAQRVPAYPAFLWMLGGIPWLILLMQHLLVLASALLLNRIAGLFNGTRAFLPAALFLLQPYTCWFASIFLSEILFIFFLLLTVWLGMRFWFSSVREESADPSLAIHALFSLFLFGAVMVRPVALALLPFFFLWRIKAAFTSPSLLRGRVLAAVVFLLLCTPWLWRNYQLSGHISFSSMGEMGMLHGRAGGMVCLKNHTDWNENALVLAGDSLLASQSGLDKIRISPEGGQTHEANRVAPGSGMIFIRECLVSPGLAIQFFGKSLYGLFSGLSLGWARQVSGSEAIAIASALLQAAIQIGLYASVFWCLVRLPAQRRKVLFFVLCWMAMIAVSTLAWADGRYRAAADPLLFVWAGFAFRKN